MKTITIEVPEGKEAKWVNGVLTLVDEQPKVEFKYKVGDKVKIKGVNQVQTITCIALYNGTPVYKTDGNSTLTEEQIELYTEPKDITERIKTFGDARIWCESNGQHDICRAYYAFQTELISDEDYNKDILAYLKLRIITCALNEGWEPTYKEGEHIWKPYIFDGETRATNNRSFRKNDCTVGYHIVFKTEDLAEYAATQFKDIYMDFCYKGKE